MIRHHEFWWRLLLKKELTQVYVSLGMRAFAISLITFFVPLYLHFELGFSLQETLFMYIFYSVVVAIITPLAAKFTARFGLKHSVIFSMPFYIAFVLVLYLLSKFAIPLVVPGALLGISVAFYWIGMHPLFYFASDHKHRGEEMGIRRAFIVGGATLGPLLGGFLIKYIGFNIVFILASILLFSSGLVLFLTKENHVRYHFSFKKILNKEHWKDSLFFVSQGTEVIANGVIWPLFIFIILSDYFSLGIVGSILAGSGAIIAWMVGKYSDKINKRWIIWGATSFESFSWFLRALVRTTGHVFGATLFGAITTGVRSAPLGALVYDKTHKEDVMGYFVSREIFISLGRILMLIFVIMIDSLAGGLIFQGFANLAVLLF